MVHEFRGNLPAVGADSFIAWNAEVAGDVRLGLETSVWHGASIRGDLAPVRIGRGSNVQDNAVLHVDTGVPLTVGEDVTIGHGAVLHGCVIGDRCLIGMGAIVLNGAEIGEESIVGAGALVTAGKRFPPRSLIIGSPAAAVREVRDEEASKSLENARHYRELIPEYRASER